MTVQKMRRLLRATLLLGRAFRPILVLVAWLCFIALSLLWVIEFGYCLSNYRAGGWPAVWGYLQNISAQGTMDLFSPISWTSVLLRHVFLAVLTVGVGMFLRRSRRHAAHPDHRAA